MPPYAKWSALIDKAKLSRHSADDGDMVRRPQGRSKQKKATFLEWSMAVSRRGNVQLPPEVTKRSYRLSELGTEGFEPPTPSV
jgi:hypothetical protein